MKKFRSVLFGLLISASPLLAAPQPAPPQKTQPSKETPLDAKEQLQVSQEPGACHFVPPAGWEYIDPAALPPLVKIMVRGKSSINSLPPSLNLAVEETSLNQSEYLDAIKQMHQYDRLNRWTSMGCIKAGGRDVAITQLDTKTKLGEARLIQAILVHEGIAYVLTATASKEEFAKFAPLFSKAIRSFTVNPSVFEMIPDKDRRLKLASACKELQSQWQKYAASFKGAPKDLPVKNIFENSPFKENNWIPFETMVSKDYADLNEQWRTALFTKVKNDLYQYQK